MRVVVEALLGVTGDGDLGVDVDLPAYFEQLLS